MTQLADETAAVVDAPVQTDSATAPVKEPETADAMYADDVGEEVNETGEDVTEPEQEEEGEPEAPAIAPPASWKGEAKEAFAQLPVEMQKTIAERETERDRFVNAKAQEAATVKQQAERAIVEQVTQHTRAYAEQLQSYAAMFEVPPPDPRLLQTGNEQDRALFYQQDADYRVTTAQREQAQQQAMQAQHQAEALEAQQFQYVREQEHAAISEKIPEWRDEASRAQILSELDSVGRLLGYSPETLAQAGAEDILALRGVQELKRKADRYDAMNKGRMEPVRAAKQQAKVLQPGTSTAGQPSSKGIAESLYPNDVRR